MRWAHISLRTLNDARPARGQRCARLLALLLSLLPVGLGVAWAIFDESHLSWHDRLSRTYLKKS
jgi:TRAP-type C4-dicarboxylate transport system permease small subunit